MFLNTITFCLHYYCFLKLQTYSLCIKICTSSFHWLECSNLNPTVFTFVLIFEELSFILHLCIVFQVACKVFSAGTLWACDWATPIDPRQSQIAENGFNTELFWDLPFFLWSMNHDITLIYRLWIWGPLSLSVICCQLWIFLWTVMFFVSGIPGEEIWRWTIDIATTVVC